MQTLKQGELPDSYELPKNTQIRTEKFVIEIQQSDMPPSPVTVSDIEVDACVKPSKYLHAIVHLMIKNKHLGVL